MNLLIDIGNTTVKMAVMDKDNSLKEYFREKDLNQILVTELVKKYKIDSSIWISTRSNDDKILDFLSRITPISVHFQPGVTNAPIENCYENPISLGADRLALAIGAKFRFPNKKCLIFDFGTAITVDYLSDKGQFLGGFISPGLQMRLLSLHEHTGALPLCNVSDMNEIDYSLPINTKNAMRQGVYRSILYEIQGYINQFTGVNVIFSGYDAKYFASKFKIAIFVKSDNLLLEGLNETLEHYKKF